MRREHRTTLSIALLLAWFPTAQGSFPSRGFPAQRYAQSRIAPSPLAQSASAPQNTATTGAEDQDSCNARMFTPNYAEEIDALHGGKWSQFPIDIWIDASTVENQDEMRGLIKGLRSWSDGTGGVLGVNFVNNRIGAQIDVRMVDSLPGGRSSLLVLGLSTIQTEGEFTTHASLKIVHPSPAILRAVGGSANPQMTRALMTQRTAAHEMGHVLMGTANLHPSQSTAVLQQDNFTVMRPSPVDINTAKVKYCLLFNGKAAPGSN